MTESFPCAWAPVSDDLYRTYHDTEWGVPLHDDRRLLEYLILDGAQAGLSWLTILRKREGYRRAFDVFDPRLIAAYDEAKVASLLQDASIVRNRQKIRSAIANAQAFLRLQREFESFDHFLWSLLGLHPPALARRGGGAEAGAEGSGPGVTQGTQTTGRGAPGSS